MASKKGKAMMGNFIIYLRINTFGLELIFLLLALKIQPGAIWDFFVCSFKEQTPLSNILCGMEILYCE